MVRPKKERDVSAPPQIQSFKPAGIPRRFLPRVSLSLDEFEAIRLADHQGLDHEAAAERMGISRTTFSRLIEKARHKTASALVEVQELFIEGGNVHFRKNVFKCVACGGQIIVDISQSGPEQCPECGERKFEDLALGFGHGACCRGRGRGRRQGPGSCSE